MPDHAGHLRVDKFLRDRGAHFGVGLVVFGEHDETRILAVDLDLGGIGLFERQARAVFIVLAQMRDAAGQGGHVADLDLDRGRRRRRLGFLATANQGQGTGYSEKAGV